jgi:drug/metabolite transporter (DMT)-like permease
MEQSPRASAPIAIHGTAAGPDLLTIGAFATTAVLAGANAVAIRVGYAELAPFWGAAVRFLAAALLLMAVAIAMRLRLPRGRALLGVVIYGTLSFGLVYMFAYWALTEVTAGTAMTILAIAPLLTILLAAAQGVERLSPLGVAGAVVAAVGVAIVFRDSIGAVSAGALLATIAAALTVAEANIVVKKYPSVHPVVENALGMAIGGALLLVLSLVRSERWAIPIQPAAQLSLAYLIVLGSVGFFVMYLFVLHRWTASAASYVLLIAPLAAAGLGMLFLDEPVTWTFVVGGAFVLAGVYLGAFHARA